MTITLTPSTIQQRVLDGEEEPEADAAEFRALTAAWKQLLEERVG